MKRLQSILILFAILVLTCCEKPSLCFERVPYIGNELRTDGFYYTDKYYHNFDDTLSSDSLLFIYYLYKDGSWFEGGTYHVTDVNDITPEMILDYHTRYPHNYNTEINWGLFKVHNNTIYWTLYHVWELGVSTKSLDSAYILNDTTFVHVNYTSGHTPYEITYHFHKFPYKPDSSVAYQWW